MSTQSDLAELYTTFFNRAPDADGLAYWVDQIDNGGLTLAQISQNWITQQTEGLSSLPSSLSNAEFIEKIYNNILGRTPDAEGAQYWIDQLEAGTLSRDTFAVTLIDGAKANTSAQGVLDSTLISNKATVGVAFADKGLNDTALAAKVLTSVSADANSLAGTLAILALVPSASADQSAAVLAATNQLLTNLATLVSSAPGELADAATYLQTLVSNITSATNLVTLLDNASTLFASAATNPNALDNPAAQGSAAVVVATPGTGGGATTFVANVSGDNVSFTGSATGAITLAVTDTGAIFTRDGISTKAVALTDTTVISLPNNAITLSAATAGQIGTIGAVFDDSAVITVTGTGAALVDLTPIKLGGSVVLDASDNKASLTLVQADELVAANVKFAANDLITLTGTATDLAGLTIADYTTGKLGGLSVVLDATENAVSLTVDQADALLDAGIKFAAGDAITLTGAASDLAELTFADYTTGKLGGVSVVLDAAENAVTLTKAQADALVAANVKFAAGDAITLKGEATALAGVALITDYISKLGGSSVVLDADENAVSLTVEQADALLAANATFATDNAITVTGAAAALTGPAFANYITQLGGASVVLDTTENAVSLTVDQADALLEANATFATDNAITVTGAVAALTGPAFANYITQLGGTSVVLDTTENAVSLTADQADALLEAKATFAASDAITLTGAAAVLTGPAFADYITQLGGASVVLDTTENAVTLTADQADALLEANATFAAGDAITVTGTGTALAALTFADYTTTALGGLSVVLDANDDEVSLTKVQADALIAADLKLAASDAITLKDEGATLAALDLADYTTAKLGGSTLALDAADDEVTLTKAQADALINSTLKYAEDDIVTVSVDNADEAAALTNFTSTALGGSKVILDALDDAWTIAAATLSTATDNGIGFAATDEVAITDILGQPAATIAGFANTDFLLTFSGNELVGEADYIAYGGASSSIITAGDFKALLVIGSEADVTEAGATFLFNTTTGTLSYDADGADSVAQAVTLITLSGVTTLTQNNFEISPATP